MRSSISPVDMSADHRQLRPVVPTAVPLPLSFLRGDNKPEDQVVEIGGPEVKLASHVGTPRSLAAQRNTLVALRRVPEARSGQEEGKPQSSERAVREIADVVVGFPTAVFTASLVVLVGLWLLVLLGAAGRDSSYDAVSLPVAAAASAVVVMSWFLCVAGSLVLRRVELPGPWHALAASAVLVGSPTLALMVVRRGMRAWRGRPTGSRKPGSTDRRRR